MDKLSYALGVSFGQQLSQNNIKVSDYQSFAKGVETILEGLEPAISFQDCQELLMEYFNKLRAEIDSKSTENKKRGEDFLKENAKRNEVTTTASGLQYEILVEAKGDKPEATDKVKVHYHGTLIDGTVFDSSVQRSTPAEFGVNQVIAGWVEALQLMSVGSKYKLYIPSDIAYGERAAGDIIQPHSTLIFEVELLDILK